MGVWGWAVGVVVYIGNGTGPRGPVLGHGNLRAERASRGMRMAAREVGRGWVVPVG